MITKAAKKRWADMEMRIAFAEYLFRKGKEAQDYWRIPEQYRIRV
jgi:uncharacterized membrane protein YsdA (DUF1294 family)